MAPCPDACGDRWAIALDVARGRGDVSALLSLVELVDECRPRSARASSRPRSRAPGAAASLAGDHDDAVDHFGRALSARGTSASCPSRTVLAGYARALVRAGRADEAEPLAAEAREVFARMGAARAIARLDARAADAGSNAGVAQERIPSTLKAGTGRANPFRVNAPTSSASTSSSTSAACAG